MRYLSRAIEYEYTKSVRLVLFSDTHLGSAHFARRHFTKFLEQSMDHPNAWLIGVGDQIDAIVPSDFKRFQLSTVHSKYLKAENPDELLDLQCADFVDIMEPYKDRIIGLIEGNHEETIRKKHGTNPHRRLICEPLGCENLGRSCLLLLKFQQFHNGTPAKTRSLTIFAHHGFGGGGRTEGGSITKYSRFMTYYDADVYVTAHDHDFWVKKVARIGITHTGKMQHKDMVLANTGAFMKTLSDTDTPSWAETRGFPPRNLGGLVLEFTPDSHAWGEIKVIE